MARNSLLCADVPLRNYTLTHSRLNRLHELVDIEVLVQLEHAITNN